jgi:GT2 family glycosyltransferase
MHPKISVIVPTYNRDRVLCDTLEFVLKQDYENYETVVVDQSERHDEYTEQYLRSNVGRIRHLRFGPPNLPAARNHGIRNSASDIVVFCDDDMMLPPNTLSSLAAAYSHANTWGATGFVVSPGMGDDEKISSHTTYAGTIELMENAPLVKIRECMGCLVSFRRELFDQIGYFDEWLGTQPMGAGEDIEFTTRMNLRGYSLYLVTSLTATHLGAKRGGCERRSLPPEFVTTAQLRIAAYCYLKNRRYPNFIGWADALWRCYRAFVLNRNVLSAGSSTIVQRHLLVFSVVPEIASVAKRNSTRENAYIRATTRLIGTLPDTRSQATNFGRTR